MTDAATSAAGERSRRGARLVLAVGVLAGLVYLAHKLRTEAWMVGLDFRVYRSAAAAALSGDPIYGTSPLDIPGMTYRYPPTVLLAFLPTVLIPWEVGYAVHTLLTVLAGAALAGLIARYLARRGVALGWPDRLLIAGFVLGSAHAMPSLVYGQVNHFVALGIAAGLLWLEDGHDVGSGVALALAALPKVFPAAIGLWLLRQRAWRAVAAALGTGVGLLGVGVLTFGPRVSRRWVTEALLPRLRADLFAGGLPADSNLVTLRRPLSVAFPSVDPTLYGVGAALLLLPVLAVLLRDPEGPLARPIGLFGLLSAILLFFPSSYLYLVYLYVAFVPLLYLFRGPGRSLFLVGSLLVTLPAQRGDVALVLDRLPTGPGVDGALLEVVGPVLTVGTPVLYGLVLALIGCVLWTTGGSPRRRTVPDAGTGER